MSVLPVLEVSNISDAQLGDAIDIEEEILQVNVFF
jgi:hypothetical protein